MTTRNVPNLPDKRLTASLEEHQALVTALGAAGVLMHFDAEDPITTPDATDLATSKTLAKALADALVAHGASTAMHSTGETIAIAAYTSDPAEPADLAETQAIANEVKADFNTHLDHTGHRGVGGQGGHTPADITTADGSDQGTTNTLLNAIKAAFNAHVKNGAKDVQVVPS